MPRGLGKVVYRSRNVTVQFRLDRKGIAACAVGDDLRDAVYKVAAHKAMPYAISISPRSGNDDEGHQHYQDSFRVEMVLTGAAAPESIGRPPMLRVGARLVNVARHASAVEWGNKVSPRGHRVLGKTLDMLHGLGKDD